LPNSKRSPRAATISCLIAVPPQVHPLMPTRWGEFPWRSNHPPQTQYRPPPSTQMVYREFRVVTSTRSPGQSSSFRTSSRHRACSTAAARVLGMPVNPFHPYPYTAPPRAGKSTNSFRRRGFAGDKEKPFAVASLWSLARRERPAVDAPDIISISSRARRASYCCLTKPYLVAPLPANVGPSAKPAN